MNGSARALFKDADALHGTDAWRTPTRYIAQCNDIRIEASRRDMGIAVARPIAGFDKIAECIAEFEYASKGYGDAGRQAYDLTMEKEDLLQALPGEFSELALWMATGKSQSFQGSKDYVITMSGRILFTKKQFPHHAVVQGPGAGNGDGGAELLAAPATADPGEMLAAVMGREGKSNRGGGVGGGRGGGGGAPRRDPALLRDTGPGAEGAERPPRQCPNCGGIHAGRKCPKPPVFVKGSTCWNGKQGSHTRAQCIAGGLLKAIEDRRVHGMDQPDH